MKTFNVFDIGAVFLIIVGGINWGLIGFFGFDLVAGLFGDMSLVSRVVYGLVGLSAVYAFVSTFKMLDLASQKAAM